jgi:hypothetical protein
MEKVPDFEEADDHLEGVPIITEVPGIERDCQSPHFLKALALEMIDDQYNPSEWTHDFTDGSSKEAVRNAGAGIFIKPPEPSQWEKSSTTERSQQHYFMQSYFSEVSHPSTKVLFRLRTGHCRLLSHLNRLEIAHTDECPCGTGSQTSEYILQYCSAHDDLRCQTCKRSFGTAVPTWRRQWDSSW